MADDRNDKGKAIDVALAQIDKQFGKGSCMRLGSRTSVDVPAIPTGALSLDAALGVGGLPRGRVMEIFGPESSGKTTLALHVIAEAQKTGGMAAFVDAEHALDAGYAGKTEEQQKKHRATMNERGQLIFDVVTSAYKDHYANIKKLRAMGVKKKKAPAGKPVDARVINSGKAR